MNKSPLLTSIAAAVDRFRRDESGVTAVEYAVMVSLIIVTAIGSISLFAGSGDNMFKDILDQMGKYF